MIFRRKRQGDYRRYSIEISPSGWGSPTTKQVRRKLKRWFSKDELDLAFPAESNGMVGFLYVESKELVAEITAALDEMKLGVWRYDTNVVKQSTGNFVGARDLCPNCGPVHHIYVYDVDEKGNRTYECGDCGASGKGLIQKPNKRSTKKEINAYVKAFRQAA